MEALHARVRVMKDRAQFGGKTGCLQQDKDHREQDKEGVGEQAAQTAESHGCHMHGPGRVHQLGNGLLRNAYPKLSQPGQQGLGLAIQALLIEGQLGRKVVNGVSNQGAKQQCCDDDRSDHQGQGNSCRDFFALQVKQGWGCNDGDKCR